MKPILTLLLLLAAPLRAEYLVIHLSGNGENRYPVSTLAAPPEGGWGDAYKGDKLVLRRIPAGSFDMGTIVHTGGADQLDPPTPHRVTLSRDFYIGVFEVTQKQWQLVMGASPSSPKGDSAPLARVTYTDIRGSEDGTGWPADNRVDSDSFMGRLRAKTSLAFDLPTEAQWEYASRAGDTGDLSANPNAWGLYDMRGSLSEWCLDLSSILGMDPVTDPKGGNSTIRNRVIRGESDTANDDVYLSRRSARRESRAESDLYLSWSPAPGCRMPPIHYFGERSPDIGLRIALPADELASYKKSGG